jgi:hypothetical protein
MSSDQNHHYIPQSYQRGWAVGGKVVVYEWRYDKVVCKPKSTKSTGGRPGLYHIPMAPPDKQNFMEDNFWKRVDQWGADALELLRTDSPEAIRKLNKQRLVVFILSLEFRHPRRLAELQAHAKDHVLDGCLRENYAAHRYAHEPDTFEDFQRAIEQPGLTEMTAEMLCKFVQLPEVRQKLLEMEWQVVSVKNSVPIITSDVPVIRYKGLRDDDGMLIFSLSPTEFFVAYNLGKIDMKPWIEDSIQTGKFIEEINRCVVGQKIEFVYAADESQTDIIAAHWPEQSV